MNSDGTASNELSLFWFVYRDLPRRLRPKLNQKCGGEVDMNMYFEEFPDTVEALILMMFRTIPEYLKNNKKNSNKATREQESSLSFVEEASGNTENRRDSMVSNISGDGSEAEKKKGGRPENKASFNIAIFDKCMKEVSR
jgi:hypothetical protein